jgi:signal transduction histidine kinase
MGMIESCVKKMDFFTIKVIEYYRNKRIESSIESIDLKSLAEGSMAMCKMQNPNLHFDFKLAQDAEFKTDAFRFSVILDNLLSNAVKYQKPDELHPLIRLNIEANENEATILIEDNGVGIIEDNLNNIFKMFFRSNFAVTGLGIGLYIVKEALTRIGGEIFVKSTFGVGTSFTLRLPNYLNKPSFLIH